MNKQKTTNQTFEKYSKHQLYNYFNFKYIEQSELEISKITKKQIFLRLLYLFLSLIILSWSIWAAIDILPTWLAIVYKYTINVLMGNVAFILPIFILFGLCLSLGSKKMKTSSFAWFNRFNKVSWTIVKRQIEWLLFTTFLMSVLIDHLILYYVNHSDEILSSQTIDLFFKNQFWGHTALLKPSVYSFAHTGFLIDTILNVLYLAGFTSSLPIVILCLMPFVAFFNFYFLNSFSRPILKLKKLTLVEYQQKLKSNNSLLIFSENTIFYINFLFAAARFYNLNYHDRSLKKLEKQILNCLISQEEVDKILKIPTEEKEKIQAPQEDLPTKQMITKPILNSVVLEKNAEKVQNNSENVIFISKDENLDTISIKEKEDTIIKDTQPDIKKEASEEPKVQEPEVFDIGKQLDLLSPIGKDKK
ncbi:hypothetical protein [Mycoplasmopsis sturni]|uniref:hypothetical protein n=1 Tax=Mycoplasmopsis sturni TaxID=39047 RepID=UPI00056BB6D0|nr:hypothetical protein [Mycoplasmopsis sturni]